MIVRPATILLSAALLCACPPPKELPRDGKLDGPVADAALSDRPSLPDLRLPDHRLPDLRPPDLKLREVSVPDLPKPDLPIPGDGAPACDAPSKLDGQGGCASTHCWIGGSCVALGTVDASNGCRVCEPSFNRYLWAPKKGCAITLAGSGAQGLADGPAYTAQLYEPHDLAVDKAGTVYIADAGAHLIRAVAGGKLLTVAGKKPGAGQPVGGYTEGAAASAEFKAPLDLVVDGSGSVFVADSGNSAIRALSCGVVSTFAGGQFGHDDGLAALAGFALPHGIARGPTGALYVVEMGNCLLRKISGGQVSTLAGRKLPTPTCGFSEGAALASELNLPRDLAVDAQGDVYIADTGNHLIRKLTSATGQVSTVAGMVLSGVPQQGKVDGAATTVAKLSQPSSVALDPSGQKLYFTDNNNCLRVLEGGVVTTLNLTCAYGDLDDVIQTKARFNGLKGVTTDAAGRVYLADGDSHKVKVYQP